MSPETQSGLQKLITKTGMRDHYMITGNIVVSFEEALMMHSFGWQLDGMDRWCRAVPEVGDPTVLHMQWAECEMQCFSSNEEFHLDLSFCQEVIRREIKADLEEQQCSAQM